MPCVQRKNAEPAVKQQPKSVEEHHFIRPRSKSDQTENGFFNWNIKIKRFTSVIFFCSCLKVGHKFDHVYVHWIRVHGSPRCSLLFEIFCFPSILGNVSLALPRMNRRNNRKQYKGFLRTSTLAHDSQLQGSTCPD